MRKFIKEGLLEEDEEVDIVGFEEEGGAGGGGGEGGVSRSRKTMTSCQLAERDRHLAHFEMLTPITKPASHPQLTAMSPHPSANANARRRQFKRMQRKLKNRKESLMK